MLTLKSKFIVGSVAGILVAMLLAAVAIVHEQSIELDRRVRSRVQLISAFGESTRHYVKETLRPAVEKVTDDLVLEAMSATFVTRGMYEILEQKSPVRFRQPAFNPLNPVNLPTEIEREILERFRGDDPPTEWGQYLGKGDDEQFLLARPIIVEASCLDCHGSAQSAPPAVTARYGTDSGFGWREGEVAGAVMITVPTSEIRADHTMTFLTILFTFIAVALMMVIIIHLLFRHLVHDRVGELATAMTTVAVDPTAVVPIVDRSRDELGVITRAFNQMAGSHRAMIQTLHEKVRERTMVLEQAREIAETQAVALKDSELRFRQLAERADQVFWMVTADGGRMLYISPAYEAIWGRSCESTYENAMAWVDAIHPEDQPAILAAVERMIGHGAKFDVEYRVIHTDGTTRWVRDTGLPVRDESGRIYRFVGTATDITERKFSDSVALERNALREGIKAMDRVLAVVGHELRTPLAAMRAMAECLLTDLNLAIPESMAFIQGIHDESVRMSNMVSNILEAARLNSGHAKWNWGRVTLWDVIHDAIRVVRPIIDTTRIQLTCDPGTRGIHMNGDGDAITRLLINLLSNAAKHTSRGLIEVRARMRLTAQGERVELSVCDTGAGIPGHTLQQLGHEFATNTGSIGADFIKGSGLGLSICRVIVGVHGGQLLVSSEVGVGSTFTAQMRADLDGPMEQEVEELLLEGRAA